MTKGGIKKTRVFISYSRQDQDSIDELHQELNNDTNLEVFLDTQDILPSEEWKPRLEGLIRAADTFLFALSANSIVSETCQWELQFANSLNKRIIPVVLQDTREETPESIAKLNYIYLDKEHDFTKTIKTIAAAIDIDIDWVREHTRIGDLSDRWDKARKLNIQPMRGKELDAAEQWLASQPKNAPFPTRSQRQYIYDSRKSATKRQRVTVAVSFIALLIVGALSVFAFSQRNAAIEGERKAQAALAAGTEAANTLVFDLANEFENSSVPSTIIESILDKARNLQTELGQNFPDDLNLQRSKANALSALGDMYLILKNTEQASAVYEESLDIFFSLVDRDPSNTLGWQDVSIGLGRVSNIKSIIGDVSGAISMLEDSLLITNDLLAFDPNNADWQRDLAVSQNKISSLYLFIGEEQKQLAALTQSAQAFRTLADLAPSDLDRQYDLSVGLSDLANAYERTNWDAARQLYEEVLVISQKLIEADSNNTLWQRGHGTSFDKIANMDLRDGDTGAAMANYSKSLEIMRALSNFDPQNSQWQADTAVVLNKIGHTYRRIENFEAALSAYRESLDIRRILAGQDENKLVWQRGMADSLVNVGDMKWDLSDLDGALSAYEEGLIIRQEIVISGPKTTDWQADVATLLSKIGRLKHQQGNTTNALVTLQESVDTALEIAHIAPEQAYSHYLVWLGLSAIAQIKSEQVESLASLEIYEQNLALGQKIINLDPNYPEVRHDISFMLDRIGLHYYYLEDYPLAYENFAVLLEYSTELKRQFPGTENYIHNAEYARVKAAEIKGRIGVSQNLELNYAEAESSLRQAIALDAEPLWMKSALAFSLLGQDKLDEADELFLKYRGQKMGTGQNWDEIVLNTISELRERGNAHPHMVEIEAMFE